MSKATQGAGSLTRLADAILVPPFPGPAAPRWLLVALENGLAGVTLFGPNIAGPEQLSELTAALGPRPPACWPVTATRPRSASRVSVCEAVTFDNPVPSPTCARVSGPSASSSSSAARSLISRSRLGVPGRPILCPLSARPSSDLRGLAVQRRLPVGQAFCAVPGRRRVPCTPGLDPATETSVLRWPRPRSPPSRPSCSSCRCGGGRAGAWSQEP